MNIRDTPIYSKHFAANEPEEHTRISIQYAIEVLEECRDNVTGRYPLEDQIRNKIAELQSHL